MAPGRERGYGMALVRLRMIYGTNRGSLSAKMRENTSKLIWNFLKGAGGSLEMCVSLSGLATVKSFSVKLFLGGGASVKEWSSRHANNDFCLNLINLSGRPVEVLLSLLALRNSTIRLKSCSILARCGNRERKQQMSSSQMKPSWFTSQVKKVSSLSYFSPALPSYSMTDLRKLKFSVGQNLQYVVNASFTKRPFRQADSLSLSIFKFFLCFTLPPCRMLIFSNNCSSQSLSNLYSTCDVFLGNLRVGILKRKVLLLFRLMSFIITFFIQKPPSPRLKLTVVCFRLLIAEDSFDSLESFPLTGDRERIPSKPVVSCMAGRVYTVIFAFSLDKT